MIKLIILACLTLIIAIDPENSVNQDPDCPAWRLEFSKNQAVVTSERSYTGSRSPKLVKKRKSPFEGRWTSHRCEVRPGSKFLARNYVIRPGGVFHLQQYYFSDPSCSEPAYVIIATGQIRVRTLRTSWIVPGALEGEEPRLKRVVLIAYNQQKANDIRSLTKTSGCLNGNGTRPWKPFRKYLIYGSRNDSTTGNDDFNIQLTTFQDCLSALDWSADELQLMRLEYSKSLVRAGGKGARAELFLGSGSGQITRTRPSSYQPALRRPEVSCPICHLIGLSRDSSPPRLPIPVRGSVTTFAGVWLSRLCEVRPYGLFLTRYLEFGPPTEGSFKGNYSYFRDPNCVEPMFTLWARGNYTIQSSSRHLPGGFDADFKVVEAKLTPKDSTFASNLNGAHQEEFCGSRDDPWRLDNPKDVQGPACHQLLGLNVPSTDYDVFRIETDQNGNSLLFLGANDPDNIPGRPDFRPTFYQEPLIQCKSDSKPFTGIRWSVETNNEVFPLNPQALISPNGSNCVQFSLGLIVVALISLNYL